MKAVMALVVAAVYAVCTVYIYLINVKSGLSLSTAQSPFSYQPILSLLTEVAPDRSLLLATVSHLALKPTLRAHTLQSPRCGCLCCCYSAVVVVVATSSGAQQNGNSYETALCNCNYCSVLQAAH
eukprot:8064-Heterococcus_DN1.PRE.2